MPHPDPDEQLGHESQTDRLLEHALRNTDPCLTRSSSSLSDNAGGAFEQPATANGRRSVPTSPGRLSAPLPGETPGRQGNGASLPADGEGRSKQGQGCVAWIRQEPLLAATLVACLLGGLLGLLLRLAGLSPQAVELLGFPGEVMLRLLKMLVLPLIAGSMIAGVCSLRGSGGEAGGGMARVARVTLAYYAGTTLTAVLLGILLVQLIRPGRGQALAALQPPGSAAPAAAQRGVLTPLEALLDVFRNMFTGQRGRRRGQHEHPGRHHLLALLRRHAGGPGRAGGRARAWRGCVQPGHFAHGHRSAVGIPTGHRFADRGLCLPCRQPGQHGGSARAVGGHGVLGLAVMGGAVLPAVLYACTRESPITVARGFSQALVMAFGTGSSAASLPVTMESARAQGCAEGVVRFVLPLGTTVNMNGTALYEATTVLFIAQAHGVELGAAQVAVVAATATLAAVGAAAIPSAGLVTMLMVLQAVSLDQYASDLAVILAIDWLLDRCRTVVNVVGDAFGTLVVDRLVRQQGPGSALDSTRCPEYEQLELT